VPHTRSARVGLLTLLFSCSPCCRLHHSSRPIAVRLAGAPYFITIAKGDKRVSHVALVRTPEDLRTIIPFLREAFDLAVSEES
jgi:hypothetical protein